MSSNFIIGANGKSVPASDTGQLLVDTRSAALYAAQNGDAFVVAGAADTSAAAADFFYLKNDDARDLVIYKIRAYTTAADCGIAITIGVSGSPTTGSALTPVNMEAKGGAANVTCEQRAGDMDLTGGSTVDWLFLDKDFVGEQEWNYEGGIILPFNTALVYNTDTDPDAVNILTQTFFYFAEAQ